MAQFGQNGGNIMQHPTAVGGARHASVQGCVLLPRGDTYYPSDRHNPPTHPPEIRICRGPTGVVYKMQTEIVAGVQNADKITKFSYN